MFEQNIPKATKGKVASVSTFTACLDVLESCQPVWSLLENVLSIDREVDQDTLLGFLNSDCQCQLVILALQFSKQVCDSLNHGWCADR